MEETINKKYTKVNYSPETIGTKSKKRYDIIVIGCGSAGLSVGLFMTKVGFNVLMVSRSDRAIGGDCLNDGCVPSKAFIHAAKIVHSAKAASRIGLQITGEVDIKRVTDYVYDKQEVIREHENAAWLKQQGIDVALGFAKFTGSNEIEVEGERFSGKKIVIATGSRPRKLQVPGVEQVRYFDNENIFRLAQLPKKLLVIGGGPIGIEIAQAMSRLGSKVTVVEQGNSLLMHDDEAVTEVLQQRLQQEGLTFLFGVELKQFTSANSVEIIRENKTTTIEVDAVFVAIGRQLTIEGLQLEKAGVELKDGKIVVSDYLQTSNKNIYVCGDVAGGLQFSHAAEYHARILLNNFFSPLKKKVNYDHISWVTFTDPEVATFGLSEKQLKEKNISYIRLNQDFDDDDRAVVDQYQYGRMVLFISKKKLFSKQKIVGGTMIAPHAGELIQELILANATGLSINEIFNKIYPYPVASRINQKAILQYKQQSVTEGLKKLLRFAFKLFS